MKEELTEKIRKKFKKSNNSTFGWGQLYENLEQIPKTGLITDENWIKNDNQIGPW